MSRLARINQSFLILVAHHLLGIAMQLIVTPLFLSSWGSLTYGSWITISAAVAYLAQADIGITAYVTPRLTKSYVDQAWSDFDHELHSATAAILGVAVTLAVVGTAVYVVLLVTGFDRNTLLLSALLAAQGVLWFVQGFIALPYNIAGRAQRGYASSMLHVAALLVGNLVVLLLGGTPLQLAWVQLGIICARIAVTRLDCMRVAPRVRFGLSSASPTMIRHLLPRSLERSLASMVPMLSAQGTLLATSATLGSLAAAVLSTNRTLVNFTRIGSTMIANSVYFEFTDLYVRSQTKSLATLLRLTIATGAALTLPLLTVFAIFGSEIYALWMRGKLPADHWLLFLLCAEVLVQAPLFGMRNLLLASNQHRLTVWVECSTVVLSIAGIAVTSRWLGVSAAPICLLVLHLPLAGLAIAKGARSVLGDSWDLRSFTALAGQGLLLIVLSAAVSFAAAWALRTTLLRVGVALGAAETLGVALLWRWMLTDTDRQNALGRLGSLPRVQRLLARFA